MAQSLLLSQLLRLLKSGDSKSLSHVGYWIGELLGDFLPGIELGEHAGGNAEYYDHLATVVMDARINDQVTVENWKLVTNKFIYMGYSEDFPLPKVEAEAGISYKQVWKRLWNTCLTSSVREVLFLLVHNKLPVRERLFRIKVAVDPYCEHCLDITGAEICDLDHFFCSCDRVVESWERLKNIVLNLLSVDSAEVSNWELINLRLPNHMNTNEVIWLLGTYVGEAWSSLFAKGAVKLNAAQLFGFMKFKYKSDQLGARVQLNHIPGLD